MRKIKIGDTITASLFGGQLVECKIESIEICGRAVSRCDIDKHSNGTIDLDCGHWCYFYQVKQIN